MNTSARNLSILFSILFISTSCASFEKDSVKTKVYSNSTEKDKDVKEVKKRALSRWESYLHARR